MLEFKSYTLFLFLAVCIGSSFSCHAQTTVESSCGNTYNIAQSTHFKTLKKDISAYEYAYHSAKTSKRATSSLERIPIQIHTVTGAITSKNHNEAAIHKSISHLNTLFLDVGLQFYLLNPPTRITTPETTPFQKGAETQLATTHYTRGAINIYLTPTLVNAAHDNICGYVANIPNKALIVMATECMFNASSLAHEMGHFLALMHTHGADNTRGTTELVDGSNCATDGDGICDTPADPQLSHAVINNFCEYTGTLTDAKGAVFHPDTYNIMSYSRKACRSQFTTQQKARMFAYYQTVKDELLNPDSHLPVSKTDAKETPLHTLSIYPNPATKNSIQIKGYTYMNAQNALSYTMINYRGQMLQKGKALSNTINVSQLAAGSYFLILETASAKIVKKIIR